jgi:hypothetical protein
VLLSYNSFAHCGSINSCNATRCCNMPLNGTERTSATQPPPPCCTHGHDHIPHTHRRNCVLEVRFVLVDCDVLKLVRVLNLPFPALWIVFFFSKPHKGTSKISWLWLSQDISLLWNVGFVWNGALSIFELSFGVAWIWSSTLSGFKCWLTQTQPVESFIQSCLVGPVELFQVAVSCPNFCHLRTPAPQSMVVVTSKDTIAPAPIHCHLNTTLCSITMLVTRP